MSIIKHLARVFLILAAAFAAFPSFVAASWTEFIPRPYENGADLEIFATSETESNKVGRNGLDWTDRFIREKLTVYSNGYSYHPRFITYRLSLSGALKQENYENSVLGSTGWYNVTGFEYDATVIALPEHPYNLRLFSRRLEPLYKQQFATFYTNVDYSKGAVFRYREKPYFFSARYIEDSIESSLFSSDIKLFGADGTYFKEYRNGNVLSLNATYDHKTFDSTAQGNGDTDEYSVGNTIDLRNVSLNSTLSGSSAKQDSPFSGPLKTDQFSWYELLHANLPLNFRTDLSYSYRKNDYTVGATGTFPEITTSATDKRVDLSLSHYLYQSLQSRYAFFYDSLSSAVGDTTTQSNSLLFNYTKSIPWGRLLAGLNLSSSVTDTSGVTVATNEQHTTPVPGSFFLDVLDVVPATLRVYLKSPLPPFGLVLLEENINYTVMSHGNKVQVTIFNLPSEFAVPETYTFLVSYSRIPAEFKSRTDYLSYNVGFELFSNMVNPYYSYSSSKTKVLSGDFPGEPPDTTLYTVGVNLRKEPFRALVEYQQQDSNVSPYSQWKGEVAYTKDIAETTRAFASAYYTDTSYSQTASAQGYSYKTVVITGNIQHQLPAKNLLLSGGGSYAHFSGPTNGSAESADVALQWKVAKFTLSLGANATHSDSESPGTTAATTTRTHQYYFMNVKRKFF